MPSTRPAYPSIALVGPLLQAEKAKGRKAAHPQQADERWDQIIDRLRHLRTLPDFWDGQCASAPNKANVDRAIAWMREMRRYVQAVPPSRAAPGAVGQVSLAWQSEGICLEADIYQPDVVGWTLSINGEPTKRWMTEGAVDWLVAVRS